MFDYNIGDRVLMEYGGVRRESTVVEVVPQGGGHRGKDPLYILRFDTPILRRPSGMVSLSDDGYFGRFHSCFLNLIERGISLLEEDEHINNVESVL